MSPKDRALGLLAGLVHTVEGPLGSWALLTLLAGSITVVGGAGLAAVKLQDDVAKVEAAQKTAAEALTAHKAEELARHEAQQRTIVANTVNAYVSCLWAKKADPTIPWPCTPPAAP